MRKLNLFKNWLLILPLAVFILFLFANIVFAQEGRIHGLVTDENGNPLANVKVTIFDPERSIKYTVKTDEKGKYYQMGLYPTTYEITFELEGYTSVREKAKVSIARQEVLNIIMARLKGINFFKEGNYEAAIDSLKVVTEILPGYFDAFYYLGISYLMEGDMDNAITSLKRAQELNPDMVGVYLYLGECYIRKGSTEEASKVFSRAIEMRPDKPVIYNIIGSLYDKYEKVDEAIGFYKKSVEIDPVLSSVHYRLGRAYLKKRDIEKSIIHFERFLELEPNDPKASRIKEVVLELMNRINRKKES